MNRNQFALLLFLLVVLGLAGLMVYNKQNDVGKTSDPAIGRKLRVDYQEVTPDGYRHPRWDRWEDE